MMKIFFKKSVEQCQYIAGLHQHFFCYIDFLIRIVLIS